MPNPFVTWAVNDRCGNTSDRVTRITLGNDALTLEPPDLDGEPFAYAPGAVRIAGREFPLAGPVRYWVGNMAWDGARMEPWCVVELLRYLRARDWTCESGLVDLAEKLIDGTLTAADLESVEHA